MTALRAHPQVVARLVTLLAAVLILLGLVSALQGSNSYVLKLAMSNASGLRTGSQVLLGGVPVGTVDSLRINRSNLVIADLHLNPAQVQVGRGASASIIAANLLGEEYVALRPGARDQPLPSGSTLPESATTLPTELDQIVDVLDGATRARVAVLLDEAGIAVAGRQSDIGAILRQFPLSLTSATRLLTTMVDDNHTLADLVARGEEFIIRMNAFGAPLKDVIGAAAGASRTLAARAAALRAAVTGAPSTLSTIQTFVHNLGNTAARLTTPVGEIADDAQPLQRLLAAVKPFTRAAVPTLNRATSVAPALTELADDATPTVASAVPTVASLQRIAGLAGPLSAWVGLSAQDLVGIISNWSRAVQFRDGLSHVFNANLYLDPSIVLNIADQGSTALQRCQNVLDVLQAGLLRGMAELAAATGDKRTGCSRLTSAPPRSVAAPTRRRPAPVRAAAPTPVPSVPAGATGGAGTPLGGVGKVLGGVGKVLGGVRSGLGATVAQDGATIQSAGTQTGSSLRALLGYLFGK